MLSFFSNSHRIDLSTLFLIFNYREWLGRVLQVDSTKKISSRRSEAHGGLKLNIQIFYQIQVSTQMNFYKCTWCSMHNYNIFSIKNFKFYIRIMHPTRQLGALSKRDHCVHQAHTAVVLFRVLGLDIDPQAATLYVLFRPDFLHSSNFKFLI